MRRRQLVRAFPPFVLSGCSGLPTSTDRPSPSAGTPTAVRRTSENVVATFRVTGTGAMRDDSAAVRFPNRWRVVVTGTIPLWVCGRATLQSLDFRADRGRLTLDVGARTAAEPTPTYECGGGRNDYRVGASVSEGRLDEVVLRHRHPTQTDRTFRFTRT